MQFDTKVNYMGIMMELTDGTVMAMSDDGFVGISIEDIKIEEQGSLLAKTRLNLHCWNYFE